MQLPDAVSTALDLYKFSSGSVNTLWNFYIAVLGAVVALVFGGKAALHGRGKLVVGTAFLAFAASNNRALARDQGLAFGAAGVVRSYRHQLETQMGCGSAQVTPPHPCPDSTLIPMLSGVDATDPSIVWGFQLVFSLALVAAIYAAHRSESTTADPPKPGV